MVNGKSGGRGLAVQLEPIRLILSYNISYMLSWIKAVPLGISFLCKLSHNCKLNRMIFVSKTLDKKSLVSYDIKIQYMAICWIFEIVSFI